MRKSLHMDHITIGVCYYPEHWDSSLWRDDLRRMKAAGIEVVRIAEFAWTIFEPKENEFSFELFDSFMDLAQEEGMKVIFCSGYKDLDGKCPMMPTPGPAAELCGVTVEDFTFRAVAEERQTVQMFGQSISADVFNDILCPEDSRVVGTYEQGYYKGSPAVTVKEWGKGKVYYFGGVFGEDTVKAFLDAEQIGMPCGLDRVLTLPREMELALRGNTVFLLNYMDYEIHVPCTVACTDQLSGEKFDGGVISMKPYGVVVLRLQELTATEALDGQS